MFILFNLFCLNTIKYIFYKFFLSYRFKWDITQSKPAFCNSGNSLINDFIIFASQETTNNWGMKHKQSGSLFAWCSAGMLSAEPHSSHDTSSSTLTFDVLYLQNGPTLVTNRNEVKYLNDMHFFNYIKFT